MPYPLSLLKLFLYRCQLEPVALQKLFIKKVSNVEYPEKRDTSEFAKELAFNIMKAKVRRTLNFFSLSASK